MRRMILAAMVLVILPAAARSADWPMVRADAARSGYTSERLPDELSVRWIYRSLHPPTPAWPTRNRLRFDRAYQPIVAGGRVFFGSSADGKVYALDAASGREEWAFFTDAPVRLAPAAWRDRVFAASDDGQLYALAARDGAVLWKRRGGPRGDMLLGNDHMLSRWPARGGPVVADGVVYFGAGIWPSEGIFLYALSAETGDVLWRNDSSGSIEMDQPHPTARARSGVSSQGHFAVLGDRLFVPTGRAVPAVFRRDSGDLDYFQLQSNGHAGGTDVTAFDDCFFNDGDIYSAVDGRHLGRVGVEAAAHPDYVISCGVSRLVALNRRELVVDKEEVDKEGKKQTVQRLAPPAWSVGVAFDADPLPSIPPRLETPENRMGSTAWSTPSLRGQPCALIVAGDKAIAGGRGKVSLIDIPSRKVVGSVKVEGAACGLAVADGRLYVSTDRGLIYCFDGAAKGPPRTIQSRVQWPEAREDETYAAAAEEILRQTKVTEGYCLDLGCGDGRLALELARRTKLQIYAVDDDPASVRAARNLLDRVGLYGVRVTVHHADPSRAPYADYFADLVVSGRSVTQGARAALAAAAERMQVPGHGAACFGKPGAMKMSVRGPLEGAGSWTHPNATPANTLCSDDRRVRGPLEMLWYRDTDFVMPNRHGRGPAPLVQDGRMFVEGIDALRAENIYNGRTLWEFPLPGVLLSYHREHSIGAAWTGGNLCLGPQGVYVHDNRKCFRLDPRTGRKTAEFRPPPRPDGKPGVWGRLACQNGLLFGSLADERYLIKCWSDKWDTGNQFTESILLFALDAETGELQWTFAPEDSIRNNAIAIGGGRVYVIDRPKAPQDDVRFVEEEVRARAKRRGLLEGISEDEAYRRLSEQPPGRLLALDRATGKLLWETDEDIFGTMLIYSAEHDALVMGYGAAHQASRASERGDRLAVFRAVTGRRLWDEEAEYADRPVLNGRTIYAPPGAWDLLTGRRLPFALERSYGCGIVAGAPRMLVFRSATLGYIDLEGPAVTQNYGGIRPGCWIPAIPAGGLLLMPDAASWCTCSYLNQATVALRPSAPDSGSKKQFP